MNREEFLQKLQEALSGEVPPEVVRDNLQYYSSYIHAERQKGRGEAEIMDELGDPRLIARTIMDTTPGGGSGEFPEYHSLFGFDAFGSADSDEEVGSRDGYGGMGGRSHTKVRYYDLSKWYWRLLAVLIFIGIFMFVAAIITGILTLLIPLLPLLIIISVVVWVARRL